MEDANPKEKVNFYKYAKIVFVSDTTKDSIIKNIISNTNSLIILHSRLHTEGSEVSEIEDLIDSYYSTKSIDKDTQKCVTENKSLLKKLMYNCISYTKYMDEHIWAPLLTHVFMAVRNYFDFCKKELNKNQGENKNE